MRGREFGKGDIYQRGMRHTVTSILHKGMGRGLG